MLYQAASGDYSPKPSELEKHKLAVLAFLRTGQCKATDLDRELAAAISPVVAPFLQSDYQKAASGD